MVLSTKEVQGVTLGSVKLVYWHPQKCFFAHFILHEGTWKLSIICSKNL